MWANQKKGKFLSALITILWNELISRSFMPEAKRDGYREILDERIERLGL